ncbi:glycerophosphodiester phosphodiesterase GDPDL6-like [Asparagus officinalis]|uniref:glycerophosphodiester phosphodiesterase GDPDL6-like n=1 Tax=Asparagus officinalis TaxID=4686 RepID=UPI00098E655B|nr:glycerophosphodiester phosphodiesterase GDPDL6-like [Asparagus officinalis]
MIRGFFLILLLIHGAAAAAIPAANNSPKWPTLSGNAPLVIARGGYSGLFPESTEFANKFAMMSSVENVVLYCNLQLAKDGAGLCKTDIRLDNSTNIATVFPKGQKTYNVNGKSITGWFAVDFTGDELNQVSVSQNILSRPSAFDMTSPIPLIGDVISVQPPAIWLNVQFNSFLKEHNLDAGQFISEALKEAGIGFISSPEINFLKDIGGSYKGSKTKLIFRFLEQDAVEPSTKSTYASLLKDLNNIKSFASGILVPKNYIWPVGSDQYLGAATTLVADAHKLGLEVYASGFANDAPASYNYSYDPIAEYLQFVDGADFSVDGVLTDFPSTASEAIACFAHNKDAPPKKKNPLIITHNGASGVFAGCTDLAYQKAVEDGADVIDCSVQMSKDGIPFCLDSADLMGDTTAMTTFMSRSSEVPEIQKNKGIFSFDLTWSEIQSLKSQLTSPFYQAGLLRNPAAKNQGKLMTLDDFLEFAKKSTLQGILIRIQNAAFLASQKGLGIVDAVSSALTKATYDKVANQQVFIQSDDTSVLSVFKTSPSYKRVLFIEETISDVPKPSADEIKKFADSVTITRSSIFKFTDSFLSTTYNVVKEMHAANISVYVEVLRNEFMAVAFDFFSDPMEELASFIASQGVDGVITEFPKTANAYLRSPCADPNSKPYSIFPVQAGDLLSLVPSGALSPAEAPAAVLESASIADPPPPLPPVSASSSSGSASGPNANSSGQPRANQPRAEVLGVLYLFMAVLSLVYYNV